MTAASNQKWKNILCICLIKKWNSLLSESAQNLFLLLLDGGESGKAILNETVLSTL